MPNAYGFVGAGELAAAIVEGLSLDVPEPPAIFLSPRGRRHGRDLAERFPNVQVCDSNQEVLQHASRVVLAVRPEVVGEVLADLRFSAEHVLASAVAGVPLGQLQVAGAQAHTTVRVIPLPSSATRRSVTVMFPDSHAARELFERVGEVIVPSAEKDLDAFSAATATFAAHLDYLATIAGWLADQGVADDLADAYVTHIFGLLGESLLRRGGSLDELKDRHMTPGGINEQLLSDLRRDQVPDVVRRALDQVLARLRG